VLTAHVSEEGHARGLHILHVPTLGHTYTHMLGTHALTRVDSTNVLDEGLRIGGIGRRMNSTVKISRNRCISKVNLVVQPGLLSICPTPSPPGPYI
jgi:hypothetical protein